METKDLMLPENLDTFALSDEERIEDTDSDGESVEQTPEKQEVSFWKIKKTAVESLLCLAAYGGSFATITALLPSCAPEHVVEKPAITEQIPTSTQEEVEEEITPLPTLEESIPTEVVFTPTFTEVPTETPEPTPTVKAESNIPSNIPTEKNENFDFEATDLLHWNEYQLVETEPLEKAIAVETAFEVNHLYLMLVTEGSERTHPNITKLTLPSGYTFGIKEKRLVRNENGEVLTLGVVENTFGDTLNSRFVLLLNATDLKGEMQGFVEEKKEENMVTFISDAKHEEIEQAKGELMTLLLLSEYQEEMGGFAPREEISLREILQLEKYLVKIKDGSRKDYYAGSNFLASALSRLSLKEDSLIEKVESKRFMTPLSFGPLTLESGNWTRAIGPREGEDFVYIINDDNPEARYYWEIQPIFANIDIPKTIEKWGPYKPNSSRILHGATIRLVEELPEGQTEIFRELLRNYNNYIANNAIAPMVIPQGITMERHYLYEEPNIMGLFGTNKVFQYIPEDDYFKYIRTTSD